MVLFCYFLLILFCVIMCEDFVSFFALLFFLGILVTFFLWAVGAFDNSSNLKTFKDVPVEKPLKEGYQG